MKLKDVKPGEVLKLMKGSQAIYVRGHFDRSSKKYSLTRWADENAEGRVTVLRRRFMSGDTEVTTEFEF